MHGTFLLPSSRRAYTCDGAQSLSWMQLARGGEKEENGTDHILQADVVRDVFMNHWCGVGPQSAARRGPGKEREKEMRVQVKVSAAAAALLFLLHRGLREDAVGKRKKEKEPVRRDFFFERS